MKLFYGIVLAVTAAMALSPFAFLKQEDLSRFDGKVVSFGVYGAKVKSIDPATCGDTTSSGVIQGSVYEGLYGYHFLKRPVDLVPLLAEAMPERSADGLTYTFKIRKGVKFSRNACFGLEADGKTPRTRTVTADDFVLAIKRIADFHIDADLSWPLLEGKVVGLNAYRGETRRYKANDFSRYDLPVAGVVAKDEYTLQIKLTRPFPQLVYVLAMHNFAPIPHEVVDTYLRPQGKPEILDRAAVVGTGAYILTEWIRGSKVVLERNPEYREMFYPCDGAADDAEAGLLADAGKRVPFIDVIYLTYVEEDNPAWMQFLTKQIDISGIPREAYQGVIGPSKELTDQWSRNGVRLLKEPSPTIYWFVFNMTDPVLGKSKSLRQALCLAYDVQTEIDLLYNGRGLPARNVVPSTFDGHQAVKIKVDENGKTAEKSFGGPSPYARYDLAAAKAKLEDARRELVAAGVIGKDDPLPTLTLDLGGRDASIRRMGEFAQQQFRQIGVTLNLEFNDWPTLQKKVSKKQCQIYTMGWHADYPDAQNFLQLYYSKNIDAGMNNANYSNPDFDRLYERAVMMMPAAERTELYARMVDILNEDCPALLLSEPLTFLLVRDWVHNVKPHPIGYNFAQYRRLDVDARRQAGGR